LHGTSTRCIIHRENTQRSTSTGERPTPASDKGKEKRAEKTNEKRSKLYNQHMNIKRDKGLFAVDALQKRRELRKVKRTLGFYSKRRIVCKSDRSQGILAPKE